MTSPCWEMPRACAMTSFCREMQPEEPVVTPDGFSTFGIYTFVSYASCLALSLSFSDPDLLVSFVYLFFLVARVEPHDRLCVWASLV